MAQMLSTFSKVEQSRFEAFQRARFAPHTMGDWVAACLSHRWNLRAARPLPDLCAVGQAPNIVLVVSVLAKLYAQRLVQTAVQLREAANDSANSTPTETTPLTADWLRRAWDERQRQGLDPGFFLQAAEPRTGVTAPQSKLFQQQRLAALEAQEKYDAWIKEQEAAAEQSNEQANEQANEQSTETKAKDKDNNDDDDDDDDDEYDDGDLMDLDSSEKN